MNIISNAVKYNKEKGEILLSYYETQVDDRHILFEFHCKDTGVGMSKEFQNHIFEPFTQETGGARSVYGGTGLGMPITKKLIEKMGGTIKFESEKSVGTTFMVQLPFLISADMKQAESQVAGGVVGQSADSGSAPQAAIDYLRSNPQMNGAFKAKYGYLPEGM